jgi:hypothetical protein
MGSIKHASTSTTKTKIPLTLVGFELKILEEANL